MNNKFGDGADPYFYPGLKVLKNKLGIREAHRLSQAELALTPLRAATLTLGPEVRGLPYLCAIHRQLFQDIYAWAGELREMDTYKQDTRFCHFAYIEKEGNALMQQLEEEEYLNDLPIDKLAERLAHYYCEINLLHPFRDGNGRAQRIFFEQLIIHAGYDIQWSKTEQDPWKSANEAAAFGDLKPLTAIFNKVVSEVSENE
ncbi:putative adenosine monophosphate-protein transferase Fic [Edaphovirga cremea]|uniref:putative adenosine monophosphate-protein transferase Fic n=1 Tax=Edaphovirga cremea TaxID=2267246 RepID=UPI000DEFDA11|nr:putative adenosine monophosphate-protein transferase Fic [Edaphovirga cremea]